MALATKAFELTGRKDPSIMDTLAAAYAESGDCDKAVQCQKQALEDKELVKKDGENMRLRLKLYEQKMPYRKP